MQGGEGIVEQAAVAEVRLLSQGLPGFAVEGKGQTAAGFEVVRRCGEDAVEGFGPLAFLQQVPAPGKSFLQDFPREVLGQAVFLQGFLDHGGHLLFQVETRPVEPLFDGWHGNVEEGGDPLERQALEARLHQWGVVHETPFGSVLAL